MALEPAERKRILESMRKYAESLEPLAKAKEARRLRREQERKNKTD
jgi:hypothetical protein